MSAPNEAATPWRRASLAAALFAIDPVGNGVIVRAGPGPVRDAWLGLLVEALPAGAPLRRAPANIADDRLLGGLDITATLRAGRPVAEPGIIAQADGGVLVLAMAERSTQGDCSADFLGARQGRRHFGARRICDGNARATRRRRP